MRNIERRELVRLTLALMAMPLAGCKPASTPFAQRTLFNFNTVCVLGGNVDESVLDEAQRLCDRFEKLFSRTIATSDVARINAAKGESCEVDPLTAELVTKALAYCEQSNGLFDITIGAVSELWDFVEGVVPDSGAIEAALPHVGWQNVEVQGNAIRLRDPMARLDLGGIAKGFMADKLVELFRQRGATSAFVNLGGNVKVWGTNERSEPWSVGVRDPSSKSGERVIARVRTTDGSVVTSGLYERSFERDGQSYWHILDPRTGYPAQTDVESASVFSVASIDGDGLTKPLFMLSREEALKFAQTHADVEALLLYADGGVTTTPNSSFEFA
ncbi:MAG: FAD:protein FMN transferase [Atopobiaceae bacterium]|nr:FAD:protein FMN transferase [Atopobiaceae bacterium]